MFTLVYCVCKKKQQIGQQCQMWYLCSSRNQWLSPLLSDQLLLKLWLLTIPSYLKIQNFVLWTRSQFQMCRVDDYFLARLIFSYFVSPSCGLGQILVLKIGIAQDKRTYPLSTDWRMLQVVSGNCIQRKVRSRPCPQVRDSGVATADNQSQFFCGFVLVLDLSLMTNYSSNQTLFYLNSCSSPI